MAETGCLKDGHFQNLEVERLVTNSNDRVQIGDFLIGKAIIHKTVKGTFDTTIRNTLNAAAAATDATPELALLTLQEYLATLVTGTGTDCAISQANATKLGFSATPAKSNSWTANMITNNTVTVINNSDSGGAVGQATAAVADDSTFGNTAGENALLLFGEPFTLQAAASLTQTITGSDALQISEGSELMFNTAIGTYTKAGEFSRGSSAGATDEKVVLTNASTGVATIKKGSFIYFFSEAAGGNKDYVVKSVILSDTSLVTPSIQN